jgi:hypothetical protein
MKTCAIVLLMAGICGQMFALMKIGSAPKDLLGITIFALSWFTVPCILMVAGIELWNRAYKHSKATKL